MEINEKIKAIIGDDYADDLTAEQILEKLNEKNLADLSKGDYVAKAKFKAEEELRKAAETARKKAEDDLNEQKKSQLSAEEKAAQEIAEALKAKDNSIETLTAELNRAKAEKVFAEAGLTEEQYANFVDGVSVDTAKSIVEMVKAREANVIQVAKEEALKNFKEPPAGKTVEKKLSEMSLDEQQKLRAENPAEYDRLLKQK